MHKTLEFNSNYNNNKLTRYNQNGGVEILSSLSNLAGIDISKTKTYVQELSNTLKQVNEKKNETFDLARIAIETFWVSKSDDSSFTNALKYFEQMTKLFNTPDQKGGTNILKSLSTSLKEKSQPIIDFINNTLETIINALKSLINLEFSKFVEYLMSFFDGNLFNQIKNLFGSANQIGGGNILIPIIEKYIKPILNAITKYDKYGIIKIFIPVISFITFAGSQLSGTEMESHMKELISNILSKMGLGDIPLSGGSGESDESVKSLLGNFLTLIFAGPNVIFQNIVNVIPFNFSDIGFSNLKPLNNGKVINTMYDNLKTLNNLGLSKPFNGLLDDITSISQLYDNAKTLLPLSTGGSSMIPVKYDDVTIYDLKGGFEMFDSTIFDSFKEKIINIGSSVNELITNILSGLSSSNYNEVANVIIDFINNTVGRRFSGGANSLEQKELINSSINAGFKLIPKLISTIFSYLTTIIPEQIQNTVVSIGIITISTLFFYISSSETIDVFKKIKSDGFNKTFSLGEHYKFDPVFGGVGSAIFLPFFVGIIPIATSQFILNEIYKLRNQDSSASKGGGSQKSLSYLEFSKKVISMFFKGEQMNVKSLDEIPETILEKKPTLAAKTAAIATSTPAAVAAIATTASVAKIPPKIEASKKKELTKKQKEYYKKLENYVLNNDLEEKKKKIKIPKRYGIIYYPLPNSIN